MKLLTLNCHSWQEENQIDKIKYLANIIKKNQYDIIALQEVSQNIKAKIIKGNIKVDNYISILIKELNKLNEHNYDFLWDCSHIGYDIYEEGLAIVTKHKITEYKSFYVSNSHDKSNYKSRNILKASIKVNELLFHIYSCHLGWWHDKDEPFISHADKLLKEIDNNKPSIIMGDFNNNAFIRNEGYDYLLSKGLIDTYNISNNKDTGITVKGIIAGWENQEENKRLDLILLNRYIETIYSKAIFNGINKKIISDHFGVEVNLNIE